MPVPARAGSAAARAEARANRSSTRSATNSSRPVKWVCSTPLAQPGLVCDRPAGEGGGAVPGHDPFRGVEKALPQIRNRDSTR
ncbi:hypothetical protein SGLAM104S_09522 [Streptomyces glaucescens]